MCGGSLWRSGFMSMVDVWALDGVRGRPAQRMKARMLICNLVSANHTFRPGLSLVRAINLTMLHRLNY